MRMKRYTSRIYKKGQISTIDLVIASGIFVSILLSAMFLWNDIVLKINRFEERLLINQKALDVSEMLIKTPGSPSGWYLFQAVDINSQNVSSVGFVIEDNVLDWERLSALKQISYDESKNLMGLSREEYNITIINVSGSNNKVLYSTGQMSNATSVLISRYGQLNGSIVRLDLRLFYNSL